MINNNKLDYDAIFEYLRHLNIGIHFKDKKSMRDLRIVQTNGKFVKELSPNDVFHKIKEGARNIDENQDLTKLYENQHIVSNAFHKKFDPVDIKKYQDGPSEITFFFLDYAVKVTKDKIKKIDYNDLNIGDTYIWESQKINHDINLEESKNYKQSNWYDFCKKASDEGIEPLMQSIGYLIHNYKDPVLAKIIVYADASQQSGANGGSGKSIIAYNAYKKVRNIEYIEGKRFNPDNQFSFQTIDEYADAVLIDDVHPKFKYQHLYNAATNDMTIEKKHQDAQKIPFEKSPKFVVTTNYGILNQGGSDKRRRNVIAFCDYFSNEHTIIDEYKQRFFHDWTKKEWDHFYGFYFAAAQKYLNKGLSDHKGYDVDRKAIVGVIGDDFVDFVENNLDRWIGKDKRVTAMNLERYINDNITIDINSQQIRRNWEQIAHMNGYKVNYQKDHYGRWYWLEETESSIKHEKINNDIQEKEEEDKKDIDFNNTNEVPF